MDEQGIDRALDVPHAGQPGRGADAGRPRADPRRHPRPQRVAARDVDVRLRGPDLRHAGHHPAHRGAGHRGARMGARARRPGRAHPAGAGVRATAARARSASQEFDPFWQKVVEQRRPGGHALLGQRLRALRQRLDGQRQRDAPVPAPGVPDAVGLAAGRGRRVGAGLPRRVVPVPRRSRWPSSRTGAAGSSRC